jgi:hypothetical protein
LNAHDIKHGEILRFAVRISMNSAFQFRGKDFSGLDQAVVFFELHLKKFIRKPADCYLFFYRG